MYWHESMAWMRRLVLKEPKSIRKTFSPSDVAHLIRRMDALEDGYDAMCRALCYASEKLGRPANAIYEEAKTAKFKEPETCRRDWGDRMMEVVPLVGSAGCACADKAPTVPVYRNSDTHLPECPLSR